MTTSLLGKPDANSAHEFLQAMTFAAADRGEAFPAAASDKVSDARRQALGRAFHRDTSKGGKRQPRMPSGGPYWPPEKLKTFNDWMTVDPTFQP